MKIERVTLREIQLRLVEPFRISSGVVEHRRILLVELEGTSGGPRPSVARAWGECVAGEHPNYGPETIDTAWLMIRQELAPRFFGWSFDHPREVSPRLAESFRGHRMARAALEMASWELAARLDGKPLAELLGGTRETVSAGVSLGIQESPEALLEKARQAFERGYAKVKAKIRPGADVEMMEPLRRAFGPEAVLAVDANAAYSLDDPDHMERLRRLDGLGLLMIEQPLEGEDLVRHARLQRQLDTDLCLDESITSPNRAEDMIELGAGRVINIKPGRVGGFAPAIAIHDLAEKAGVPVWCGGMLESGVGRAHNVALASLPNFRLPGDLSPSERYWARDVVTPAWEMDHEGEVRVPWDKPGPGVEIDQSFLDSITVRTEEVDG